jgi:hypothetical protein
MLWRLGIEIRLQISRQRPKAAEKRLARDKKHRKICKQLERGGADPSSNDAGANPST